MSSIGLAPIPVVLCIDVEPDEQRVPRTGRLPWKGFEAALEWIRPMRDALESATDAPARFGWFLRMDEQITVAYGSHGWVAENHGPALDALRKEGDELGVHPHAWRDDGAGGWLVDIDNSKWVAQVTADSFDAYLLAFGQRCVAHRFGDGFLSQTLLAQLDELGVNVDLTAEPGMTLVAAKRRESRFVGQVPYSAGAARTSSRTGGVRLIPLTALDPDAALPAWRRVARRLRYPGQPRHRQMVLSTPWPSRTFWDLMERDIDSGELDVLAFGVRSGSFNDLAVADVIADKLRGLAHHPMRSRVRFTTPSEAADILNGQRG